MGGAWVPGVPSILGITVASRQLLLGQMQQSGGICRTALQSRVEEVHATWSTECG